MADDLAFALYSLKARKQNKIMTYNYESLVRNSKDPVLVLDNKGSILFTNPAADNYYDFGNMYNEK